MTQRKTAASKKKKTAPLKPKTKSTAAHPSARRTRTKTIRDIHCADFVGGDQHNISYGFTVKDVDALIEKVLAFIKEGAVFAPTRDDRVRAELDGQTLTFQPGAITQLAGRRDLRSYLLSLTVRQDYLVWATKFIPLAAKVDKRTVAGLQMPVAYSAFRVPREGEGGQAAYEQLQDITQALREHNAFVILGEPGAGKTTTLQKIAFEGARTLLSEPVGRTPLFVRLSQQHGRDPFEFLQKEWEQRTGSNFADALAAGEVLILADGVNEIARDERDERLKDWRVFVEEYRGANQILFTGREKDYESQLDLPRVRVDPLEATRIADYLKRNDALGLAEQVADERAPLYAMARNPFNLSLLVHAYLSNQRDIGNRGYLLDWFVDELFKREEKLAHRWWLPRAVQVRALAQMAFAMQEQGEGTTFSLQTAKTALPKTYDVDGDDLPLRADILARCARAATLLDPALDDLRFYHHLLQEYFAALELLRRFAEGEDLARLWRSKRLIEEMPPAEVGEWDALPEPPPTGWEVTTILAVGLLPNPARLIEAVRLFNPNLAGRCILESGVDPATIQNPKSKIQNDLLADLYNPTVHLRARLQAGFTLGRLGDPRFGPTTLNDVRVIVPQMVDVPAGRYVIGSDESDPQTLDDEKLQQTVDLPAFAIGKWPVTNAEYACFIEANGYKDERWWPTDLAKRWLKGEEVPGGQLTTWLATWKFMNSNANWKEQWEGTGSFSPDQLKNFGNCSGL